MTKNDDLYIQVVNWKKFQHYQTGKHAEKKPEWIKFYPRIFSNLEFISLSEHRRFVLISLWVRAALDGNSIPCRPQLLSKSMSTRITFDDLKIIENSGFIKILSRQDMQEVSRLDQRREEIEKKDTTNISKSILESSVSDADSETNSGGGDGGVFQVENLIKSVYEQKDLKNTDNLSKREKVIRYIDEIVFNSSLETQYKHLRPEIVRRVDQYIKNGTEGILSEILNYIWQTEQPEIRQAKDIGKLQNKVGYFLKRFREGN